MNLPECGLPKTHKEIVRIMVFSIPCLTDGQATSNTKARAPLPGFSRVIWDEWGKKGVRMDTKALKKQMGAAIAMVLVAAVALGSATFAWFVTNSKVDATTSTISAQSNAAFMTIANGVSGAKDVDDTSVATEVTTKPLFPATYGEETGSVKGTWMTGFGKDLDHGDLSGTLVECKDPKGTATAGTTAAALAGDYILQQDYNISSKGQNLTGLQVSEVKVAKDSTSQSELLRRFACSSLMLTELLGLFTGRRLIAKSTSASFPLMTATPQPYPLATLPQSRTPRFTSTSTTKARTPRSPRGTCRMTS